MQELLIQSPVLLLFAVAGLGFLLGRIRIGEFGLGISAVLFVGIAFNAYNPELRIPDFITVFGLALFVYTLGLSSGPAFSASLRDKGLRDNLFALSMMGVALGITWALAQFLQLSAGSAAGLFAGSLSSTPSLAGVIEQLGQSHGGAASKQLLAEPVVAYSVTYPVSVFGMLVVIYFLQKRWKVDFATEARALRHLGASGEALVSRAVRITHEQALGQTLHDLLFKNHWRVTFGRCKRDGEVGLATDSMSFQLNDEILIVGTEEEVQRVIESLGVPADDSWSMEPSAFGMRRFFVSDPKVAGKKIREINLPKRYSARITRIRRGDIDIVPMADTRLELGDRVRVVARHERMDEIGKFLGDSYKALSEIDIAVFSLGIALGLVLGSLRIPLPDGSSFRLGFAGGPLLVGLLLGMLQRTGPVVWHLPYSANLTLRQLGMILFLAGVGTSSGHQFVQTMTEQGELGIQLFLAGTLITCGLAVIVLWIGYRVLHIPWSLLMGILGGIQTQATVLIFAGEQTKNDIPTVGYASVYAVATVSKIILAQLLLTLVN